MEKAEMEDRETEDRGVESKLYGGGGATRGDGTTRRGKQEGGVMRGEVTTSGTLRGGGDGKVTQQPAGANKRVVHRKVTWTTSRRLERRWRDER